MYTVFHYFLEENHTWRDTIERMTQNTVVGRQDKRHVIVSVSWMT